MSRLHVVVMPRALRELMAADDWWQQHRPGTAYTVDTEFERALALLTEKPELGTPVDKRHAGHRRWLVRRISYWIYYRARGDELQVLRFWHTSRTSPR